MSGPPFGFPFYQLKKKKHGEPATWLLFGLRKPGNARGSYRAAPKTNGPSHAQGNDVLGSGSLEARQIKRSLGGRQWRGVK